MKRKTCLKFFLAASLILFSLSLNACGPTYPADKVEEAVVKICKNEYNLIAKPKIIGNTLWLYIPLDHLVNLEGKVDQFVSKKIEDAAFSLHRVLLSTDRKLDFYVLVASDVKYIGLDYMIVGYVPDVRRVRLLDISRADYFQRMLHDLKLDAKALNDYNGTHVDYVDISLQKFLAEQITQRIKNRFSEDKSLSKYFSVKSADWEIENHIFIFDVNLQKLTEKIPAAIDSQKIMLSIAAFVFKSYKLKDFEGVWLFNSTLNQSTYLNRSQVYSFKGKF